MFDLGRKTVPCPSCGTVRMIAVEKGVDVALATKLLVLANARAFDTAILIAADKDRDQLYEYQRDSEIIPRRDIKSKEKKTDFKDKQLEMALDYLRSQIKTAKSVTKRAG